MERTDVEFQSLIMAAIESSFRAISAARPSERIVGYALMTDDGLGTIGHVACSDRWLLESGVSNGRFEPVEWVYGEGVEAFASVRERLRESAKGSDFSAHVEGCFSALVNAMAASRAAGIFPDEIFLTVISTDPSARLLELEELAVARLNSDVVVHQWKLARS